MTLCLCDAKEQQKLELTVDLVHYGPEFAELAAEVSFFPSFDVPLELLLHIGLQRHKEILTSEALMSRSPSPQGRCKHVLHLKGVVSIPSGSENRSFQKCP